MENQSAALSVNRNQYEMLNCSVFVIYSPGWDSVMSSMLLLVHLLPPSSQGRKRPGKISARQACDSLVKFIKVSFVWNKKGWKILPLLWGIITLIRSTSAFGVHCALIHPVNHSSLWRTDDGGPAVHFHNIPGKCTQSHVF